MRTIERRELAWGLFVLGLGLAIRAIFITVFPTRAVIDAHALIDFSRRFADGSVFDHSERSLYVWRHWNPGMPMYLALFVKLFGTANDFALASTARWTVAITSGTVGLIPYTILRGVVTLRIRLITASLLTIWPGQVIFSGVILQDNLVILPTVALASLGIRASLLSRGYPVSSAALFILSSSIRQETLLTNLPVFLLSSGVLPAVGSLVRRIGYSIGKFRKDTRVSGALVTLGYAAGILIAGFIILAGLRWFGTGRFAVTTTHGGTALLGAYAPGAGLTGYIHPLPLAAALGPGYTDGADGYDRLNHDAFRLALQEALRRPFFHAVRIVGTITYHLKNTDVGGMWWAFGTLPDTPKQSVQEEEAIPWSPTDAGRVLPNSRYSIAKRLFALADPCIKAYQWVLHSLFVSAFLIAFERRWWPLMAIGSSVLVRVLFHGITVIQPRLLLVNTALELLMVMVGAHFLLQARPAWNTFVSKLAAGFASVSFLYLSISPIGHYVSTHENEQLHYRFSLLAQKDKPSATGSQIAGKLHCRVNEGTLTWLDAGKVTIRLLDHNPSPGARAAAQCALEPSDSGRYNLVITDSYPHGGVPDRVAVQVSVDDEVLLRHDLGDTPFTGDMTVSLGNLSPGDHRDVLVEVLAVRPDPGAYWGSAAPVTMRVTMAPSGSTHESRK